MSIKKRICLCKINPFKPVFLPCPDQSGLRRFRHFLSFWVQWRFQLICETLLLLNTELKMSSCNHWSFHVFLASKWNLLKTCFMIFYNHSYKIIWIHFKTGFAVNQLKETKQTARYYNQKDKWYILYTIIRDAASSSVKYLYRQNASLN